MASARRAARPVMVSSRTPLDRFQRHLLSDLGAARERGEELDLLFAELTRLLRVDLHHPDGPAAGFERHRQVGGQAIPIEPGVSSAAGVALQVCEYERLAAPRHPATEPLPERDEGIGRNRSAEVAGGPQAQA